MRRDNDPQSASTEDGETPLDRNESAGLRLDYVTTRGELNEAEQDNILKARRWAFTRKRTHLLADTFLRDLHKRMFHQVWDWAGRYRTTEKSIGVEWTRIPTDVIKLCEDTKYWIANVTYNWPELAARFHHRLVVVHPFPNGNGRHARLATDLLLDLYQQPALSWGAQMPETEVRKTYIEALRAADVKNFTKLIAFIL